MSLAEIVPAVEERSEIALDFLLAPIPGSQPTGQEVRYAGDHDAIIEARRQDNAALPQGVWLRELKRADWVSVESLCVETLTTRSKDLQVAGWLTETWIHLRGFAGLEAGLTLLCKLCERFWPHLFPVIQEGDLAARVAPLEWLNEKLPDLLRSLPIVRSATDPDERFSWTDYINAQRLETVRQRDLAAAERAEAAGAVTLARFGNCRQRTETAALKKTESVLKRALSTLDAFNGVLQLYCGKEAPGLGGIRTAVEEILAFDTAELASRRKPLLASLLRQRAPGPPDPIPTSRASEANGTIESPRTRQDAYQQLSEIAEFLLRMEPHSPTPYLVQCAASWGELPLPELLQQLSQSGSDIAKLLDVLGLLQPSPEIDQGDANRQ
ncbi:MAG TPA: type VI secretion system protein TssA [Stellaceae bacterium]